ncbi:MAG: glycoside-pentoside-hexuronide (GPH):cation symporter [Lachnospiraceae bacterium]|nr:glycoside-pentoside-hexuronide (GPH):cation symporter [Lachnospiraceae bacterium]
MEKKDESYIARTSGLKARDYFGYALGDAAGCLVFSLVTSILQKYYTDVFHLSPLFIMFMFIGARIWDAVNDPIMGRICDTVKPSRYGRYRQWFLYVATPLCVLTILMFMRFPGLGGENNYIGTCIYATFTYILWGMCYTVLQIPYGSLASVVTTDVTERNKLSVFRSIGAAVGSIPVFVLVSFIYQKRTDASGAYVYGENGKIITDMQYGPVIIGVSIMAIISALLLFLTFALNKERVITKPAPREKGAGFKAIGTLLKNRAFLAVSLTAMLLLAGQMFTQSFYLYLFNDYFNANWMNLASQACTYSPMIIFMFFLPKMARKLGKKEISTVGVAFAALANFALFLLRGMEPSKLMYLFLALCFVSGLGLTTLVMQLWAMATDAIDDIEVTTGSRDDGTAYSFFNFFRKLGQVIAAVCVNGALLNMNYKYEKGAVQSLENLKKMYDLSTLIPAVLFGLMALILFFMCPLSKKRVDRLQVEKEAKLKESYENNIIDIA